MSSKQQSGFKYAVTLAYQGSEYCGWQRQVSASGPLPSIQATVEAALESITGEAPSVVGSGRTDSGVHAIGQVAHFFLRKKEWDPQVLKRAFSSRLPQDIRVARVQAVPVDFHAQRSADRKQYSYYFQQGPCAVPHLEPLSWWIQRKLDPKAMQRALDHLVGEHDFKPFQSSGAKPGLTTVRKILEARILEERMSFPGSDLPTDFYLVRMKLVGTGFLKQMVRGIAGTLLEVGEGRRDPDSLKTILDSGDRKKVGPTAPARALWLEKVWYPERFGISD